jgi:hypothetical protein
VSSLHFDDPGRGFVGIGWIQWNVKLGLVDVLDWHFLKQQYLEINFVLHVESVNGADDDNLGMLVDCFSLVHILG